jgi:hypothetical protein
MLNNLPKDILIKIIESDFSELSIESILKINDNCLKEIIKKRKDLENVLLTRYKIENIEIVTSNYRDIIFVSISLYLEINHYVGDRHNPVSIWKGKELFQFHNLEEMFAKLICILSDFENNIVKKIVELIKKLSDAIISLRNLNDKIYRIKHFC